MASIHGPYAPSLSHQKESVRQEEWYLIGRGQLSLTFRLLLWLYNMCCTPDFAPQLQSMTLTAKTFRFPVLFSVRVPEDITTMVCIFNNNRPDRSPELEVGRTRACQNDHWTATFLQQIPRKNILLSSSFVLLSRLIEEGWGVVTLLKPLFKRSRVDTDILQDVYTFSLEATRAPHLAVCPIRYLYKLCEWFDCSLAIA